MILRTPRRRISPRTKRRYRAIKDFIRRAIGSSQQDIKINSSIAINVTDLKHKIIGKEQQLDEVNKYCQIATDSESSSNESRPVNSSKRKINTINEQSEKTKSYAGKLNANDTKILYKTSENQYKKSDDSESIPNETKDANNDIKMSNEIDTDDQGQNMHITLGKNKKSKLDHKVDKYNKRDPNKHKHYRTVPSANTISSYHSLAAYSQRYVGHGRKHIRQPEYTEPIYELQQEREGDKKNKSHSMSRNYDKSGKHLRRHKSYTNRDLDQDFIADIIRRQYRPVQLFGRRNSDLSQFSVPICRDRDLSGRENIQKDFELCSCCYTGHNPRKYRRSNDLSDMRSICDTRLYSSQMNTRKKRHKRHVDIYNDANVYDVVPVKEKSSPKSRRKFIEKYYEPNEYYREVPPSPKSQRPKLNLKSQYYNQFDDYTAHINQTNNRSPYTRHKIRCVPSTNIDIISDTTPSLKTRLVENLNTIKVHNEEQIQGGIGTANNPNEPSVSEQQNVTLNSVNDTLLDKSQDSETNKTDKTLSEIKVILQNFLQEIKKENTAPEPSTKQEHVNTNIQQDSTKMNTCFPYNNGLSNCHTCSVGQCTMPSYVPSYPNPCCYPVLPMCPMNCMHNGYVMPTPSFTCQTCTCHAKENISTERQCSMKTKSAETSSTKNNNNETEELIKEIYKFVAQKSPVAQNSEDNERNLQKKAFENQVLTTRSVGASSRIVSRRDAKVGTPKMKCYSKSCEAIGSRLTSEPYYSKTNASYSDTLLEKLSLEVTHSTDSEMSNSETNFIEKPKRNKFTKVLRSFGLFKKKKQDVIEELSESETTVEVEVKKKPPFRQEITNYVMHGQEYYNPPPSRPPQQQTHYEPRQTQPRYEHCQPEPCCEHNRPECGYRPHNAEPRYGYHPPGYCGCLNQAQPPIKDIYNPHRDYHTIYEHGPPPHYHPPKCHRDKPSAPPCEQHFNTLQSQAPLCLKEIEVKSTGTQSERKMSFFQKLTKKPPPPTMKLRDQSPQRDYSTQTAQNKGLWKSLQEKAMQDMMNMKQDNDPLKFSFKAQKELAEGNIKMRNHMLKKLFYKRNPFSPRNLIVRTLLGKDKSSFGEPPYVYRPRMFL